MDVNLTLWFSMVYIHRWWSHSRRKQDVHLFQCLKVAICLATVIAALCLNTTTTFPAVHLFCC